jgi:hypothetical protein
MVPQPNRAQLVAEHREALGRDGDGGNAVRDLGQRPLDTGILLAGRLELNQRQHSLEIVFRPVIDFPAGLVDQVQPSFAFA